MQHGRSFAQLLIICNYKKTSFYITAINFLPDIFFTQAFLIVFAIYHVTCFVYYVFVILMQEIIKKAAQHIYK